MDHNDSDAEGSLSNHDDEDDMHASDYDDEEELEGGGSDLRLKMEPGIPPDMAAEIMSRYKQQDNDREDIEKVNERITRDMFVAVQRHAAQAVAAAAAAQGMSMQGMPWALNPTVGASPPGPLPLALAATTGNGPGVLTSVTGGAPVPATTTSMMSSSSPGGGSGSSGPTSSSSHLEAGKGYTFEEQFKQLYELSEDPKRKEFLDDVFTFMQKRGTPVNRIPIMAKQVLDLFELYRLVVARGGLVEVINKKIWREITKGLNLPSSITSAAFTLRTQYMKYLYPYECEKEKLSTPEELQAAIDGNRREGRRSSYGHYGDMMGATPPPSGAALSRNHTPSHHHTSPSLPISLVSRHVNGHSSQGNSSGEEDNGSLGASTPHGLQQFPTQDQALNLDMKGPGSLTNNGNGTGRDPSNLLRDTGVLDSRTAMEMASRKMMEEALGVTPAKRFMSDEERYLLNAVGLPNGISIKLNNRDGRSQMENSLVVSMEINGLLYQGVLFASKMACNSKSN